MTSEQRLSELARQLHTEQQYGTRFVYRFEELDAMARCRALRDRLACDPHERPVDFSDPRFWADGTVIQPRWK